MSTSNARPDMEDLEGALIDLSRHLPYPPTPDVAPAVIARLEGMDSASRLLPLRLLHRQTGTAAALAVLLFLAGLTLIASPAARAAVGAWLGIPGVRITTGSPSSMPGRTGSTLHLGRPVSLAIAQQRVSFHVVLPARPPFHHPDGVYLDTSLLDGRVSLLYRAHAGLPPTRSTGVGLLLTEFRDTDGRLVLGKMVGWKSAPQRIMVGGDHGYWIKGAHLTYTSGPQPLVWTTVRLAGNTLLWDHDGLTLRLESALSEREALRLARSLR